jgi:steroid delta-isomerase-like uncharacterized protein
MSVEENKAIVRRYFEAFFNQGNLAVADEIIAEGYQSTLPGVGTGLEGQKQLYQMFHAGFPDLRFTIEDLIAEGDKVVARWTARATHQGEFQGIAPTGKQVAISWISIDRISDGKMQETWANYNQLGMLQQLGVIPERTQA